MKYRLVLSLRDEHQLWGVVQEGSGYLEVTLLAGDVDGRLTAG